MTSRDRERQKRREIEVPIILLRSSIAILSGKSAWPLKSFNNMHPLGFVACMVAMVTIWLLYHIFPFVELTVNKLSLGAFVEYQWRKFGKDMARPWLYKWLVRSIVCVHQGPATLKCFVQDCTTSEF